MGRMQEVGGQLDDLIGLTKEEIIKRVRFEMLNANIYRERKEDPHFDYIDLIGVFYVNSKNGSLKLKITKELAQIYDISYEELYEAAVANVKKDIVVRGLLGVIKDLSEEITGIEEDIEPGDAQMYIITNSEMHLGAAALMIPDPFEYLSGKLHDDLYVLPASRHEVLAVPKNGSTPESLRKIVSAVNEEEVNMKDFLSNEVYQYTRGTGVIELAG